MIWSSSNWSGMSWRSISSPAVARRCDFGPWTRNPSSSSSSSCSLAAITSMRPACSASSAVRLTASVTIFAARSPLRPCSSASARTYAAASFSIFRPSTSFVSPGPIEIGVAEPMFVCGAIAATSVASVMNNPAEAARAPSGDTYAITGIGAAMMSLTISRVELSSPPGVSMRMIATSAPLVLRVVERLPEPLLGRRVDRPGELD